MSKLSPSRAPAPQNNQSGNRPKIVHPALIVFSVRQSPTTRRLIKRTAHQKNSFQQENHISSRTKDFNKGLLQKCCLPASGIEISLKVSAWIVSHITQLHGQRTQARKGSVKYRMTSFMLCQSFDRLSPNLPQTVNFNYFLFLGFPALFSPLRHFVNHQINMCLRVLLINSVCSFLALNQFIIYSFCKQALAFPPIPFPDPDTRHNPQTSRGKSH